MKRGTRVAVIRTSGGPHVDPLKDATGTIVGPTPDGEWLLVALDPPHRRTRPFRPTSLEDITPTQLGPTKGNHQP